MAPEISYAIGEMLKSRRLTISSAESCTGGLIAHYLTMVSGCSAYFTGSVVSYTNEVKMKVLGVSAESIAKHTEVSGEVACQMAEGVRQVIGTDIGVSTTGIAGPTGELPGQPVGTVWISVSTPWGGKTRCYHFQNEREGNIAEAAEAALNMVMEVIGERPDDGLVC